MQKTLWHCLHPVMTLFGPNLMRDKFCIVWSTFSVCAICIFIHSVCMTNVSFLLTFLKWDFPQHPTQCLLTATLILAKEKDWFNTFTVSFGSDFEGFGYDDIGECEWRVHKRFASKGIIYSLLIHVNNVLIFAHTSEMQIIKIAPQLVNLFESRLLLWVILNELPIMLFNYI